MLTLSQALFRSSKGVGEKEPGQQTQSGQRNILHHMVLCWTIKLRELIRGGLLLLREWLGNGWLVMSNCTAHHLLCILFYHYYFTVIIIFIILLLLFSLPFLSKNCLHNQPMSFIFYFNSLPHPNGGEWTYSCMKMSRLNHTTPARGLHKKNKHLPHV